ncbi:MAG: chemotaxis protein CheA [Candidatus Omnitrophica bacterium]|nr:chemotaxis protein CheA [Candidatus Omnitrophota bacterium]MBU1851667.1 chemotaxis protein CheA [Candidatus Omnitrophota bacterium]
MNKFLLKLEKHPGKSELVGNIFRNVHTLKSMAGAMEYKNIAGLCHSIEDVLDAIRKKGLKPEKCIDILFKALDMLEKSLKEIAIDKEELEMGRITEKLRVVTGGIEAPAALKKSAEAKDEAAVLDKITSIEVKVQKLDLLMNLAEELLINKMQLDQIKKELQNPGLTAVVDALGRLVTDIQYNIMGSRLVPIGFVFDRFPRMVRDLAKDQKKEIDLEIEGADIELDRGVIDEIGESLVHLIRNAVDHGIETQDVRRKAGKPSRATIRLAAKRKKGFAVIEVSDDGAGLGIEDIKNTAIKKGVISQGATEEEIINSIFFGVSTTKQVTAVSGRGFGMDIVKAKVESIGGSIKAVSNPGIGTKFFIEIPLTLAIIKTLFVEVSGKPYAIPLVNIARLVTVDKEDIKGMLNYEAIVLDEEDIPITRLNMLFDPLMGDAGQVKGEQQLIVIIKKGEEKLGLVVDSFMSTQEIVIKPLNRLVKENKYFGNSTIIGSGEVVLILDVANLMLTKREKIGEWHKQ